MVSRGLVSPKAVKYLAQSTKVVEAAGKPTSEVVTAVGLGGLARRDLPERTFWAATLALAVLVMASLVVLAITARPRKAAP